MSAVCCVVVLPQRWMLILLQLIKTDLAPRLAVAVAYRLTLKRILAQQITALAQLIEYCSSDEDKVAFLLTHSVCVWCCTVVIGVVSVDAQSGIITALRAAHPTEQVNAYLTRLEMLRRGEPAVEQFAGEDFE